MPEAARPWVDGLTFAEALERTVARCGSCDALVFPELGYRRTYREFHADVRDAARALMALGAQRGEHVGIWATNWPEWVILQFATACIGTPLVNINPAYRARELEYVLRQADITTLFLTDRFKTSGYFEILASVCPELKDGRVGELRIEKCPKLKRVVSIKKERGPGMLNWEEFRQLASQVSLEDLERRQAEARFDEVANIQYTSGTTGFPKGAQLTYRNVLMNAYYIGRRLNFSEADRLCLPVPFYHCFGCVLGTLLCSLYGAAIVAPAEGFDARATLEAIQAERCTGIYGVPTMFIAELNHPDFASFDLSSLRTGIMAGSPCPIEVMRKVVDVMGAREITIAYGLTESSPVITQTETTDSLENRVTTVGKPLPGLAVKIVEPGTLDPVRVGEQGELLVHGHSVMVGYYNEPQATADAITEDGWLHSGDLAVETDDGFYKITGRIKEMIVRGGENVYPREIEEFLFRHAKIADAYVVGLPDEKFGEEISAWVQLKEGELLSADEVRDFCRGSIAHYKIPRYVFFVDEYPKTVTGKIQKFKLREEGIKTLGLEIAADIETA